MDYTNLYDFNTNNGIIVPNDSSVLSGIQNKFKEIFGTAIDLSAETPVGRLIEALSVVVKTTLGVTAQTSNQFNINEATGIYLDSIAQIYGMKRVPETRSRMTVRCGFTNQDVVIDQGALILSNYQGALFQIDSNVSNDISSYQYDEESGRYFTVVTATAIDIGPIVCPKGTYNIIQSSVPGWVEAVTENMTYIGTEQETDEAFRKRLLESRPIGIGFNSALTSKLNRLDGVYSTCILDNNTAFDVRKLGIRIPPHSVFACVDFVETESIQEDIAYAIAAAKPVGVGMVKDGYKSSLYSYSMIKQTISYGYDGLNEQDIYFCKANRIPVDVFVSCYVGKYSGSNLEGDVRNVVSEYMDTVGVGGIVYGAMIANELTTKLNIGINSVLVKKHGYNGSASVKVGMYGCDTPYSVAENISVTT